MYIYRKLKKSQLQVNEAFFWIAFSTVLILLGFFPELAVFFANIFGVASASNFIFLCVIFLLILKVFLLTIKVSTLEQKVVNLVQEIAIRDKSKEDQE